MKAICLNAQLLMQSTILEDDAMRCETCGKPIPYEREVIGFCDLLCEELSLNELKPVLDGAKAINTFTEVDVMLLGGGFTEDDLMQFCDHRGGKYPDRKEILDIMRDTNTHSSDVEILEIQDSFVNEPCQVLRSPERGEVRIKTPTLYMDPNKTEFVEHVIQTKYAQCYEARQPHYRLRGGEYSLGGSHE